MFKFDYNLWNYKIDKYSAENNYHISHSRVQTGHESHVHSTFCRQTHKRLHPEIDESIGHT
jgi:hypothetical protein